MDYREVIQVGYVERGTGKHQSNEVYDPNGLARTLQAGDWKSPLKIIINE
ncbi:MAG: hypothetical protein IKE94_00965 [Aeriscardovia sp.]|nr:hypothetical protein [Aeriscardovia sp.]